MDKKEAKKRIGKLKAEINHHRYLYHVLDKPDIDDAAFDSLKNELEKLEEHYPDLITPDSPTQRVGGKPLDKFVKVRHSKPMMSLFDAFTREDMEEWEGRIRKILDQQIAKPSPRPAATPLHERRGGERVIFRSPCPYDGRGGFRG